MIALLPEGGGGGGSSPSQLVHTAQIGASDTRRMFTHYLLLQTPTFFRAWWGMVLGGNELENQGFPKSTRKQAGRYLEYGDTCSIYFVTHSNLWGVQEQLAGKEFSKRWPAQASKIPPNSFRTRPRKEQGWCILGIPKKGNHQLDGLYGSFRFSFPTEH